GEGRNTWLLGSEHNDIDAALEQAPPYLRLFALAAAGALLAEEALAAMRLAGNGADAAGRPAVERFFAENLAVQAASLERTVVEAADSVTDADPPLASNSSPGSSATGPTGTHT